MGLYPTVPSRRMAYDDDGTAMIGTLLTTTTVPAQSDGVPIASQYQNFSTVSKQTVNNENPSSYLEAPSASFGAGFIVAMLLFPELREIDGYFVQTGGSSIQQRWLYSSGNTTNGRDGSWSAIGSQTFSTDTDLEAYRDHVVSAAISNVRSVGTLIRSSSGSGRSQLHRFHLYGEISPGETPDRVLFIDESTGLEFDLPVDFEEVPRGSAREWEFRLKNNSTIAGNNLTLNTVQFTAEDLYLTAAPWFTFSVGGDAFQSTKMISSLAPEASSALITGRQTIPTTEVVGVHAARIRASVASVS